MNTAILLALAAGQVSPPGWYWAETHWARTEYRHPIVAVADPYPARPLETVHTTDEFTQTISGLPAGDPVTVQVRSPSVFGAPHVALHRNVITREAQPTDQASTPVVGFTVKPSQTPWPLPTN